MSAPPLPPPPSTTDPAIATNNQSANAELIQENAYFKIEISERKKQLDEIHAVIHRELATANDPLPTPWVIYAPISHVFLQQGPTCGIVALEMAGVLLEAVTKTKDREYGGILEVAVEEGFTKKGEMFSVYDMSQLAAEVFPELRATVLDTQGDFWKQLIQDVFDGNIILMPYDAGGNHSPSLRRGHSAHWAVIHGVMIINSEKPDLKICEPDTLDNLERVETSQGHKVIQIEPKKIVQLNAHAVSEATGVYVLAHQGKSTHVGVWNLRALLESNQNLNSISPKILKEESEYVLRDIVANLNGKAVILSRP